MSLMTDEQIDGLVKEYDAAPPDRQQQIAQQFYEDRAARQQQARETDLANAEKMFTDPQTLGGAWTPQQSQMSKLLGSDEQQDKMQFANTAYIAAASGRSTREVAKGYEPLRDAIAQHYWGKPQITDQDFYNTIKGNIEAAQKRQQQLGAAVGAGANSALEDAVNGKPLDWAANYSAYNAAQGRPSVFLDTQEWQNVRAAAQKSYDLAIANRDLFGVARDVLARQTGRAELDSGKTAETFTEAASRIAALPPEDRQSIYGMLTLYAQQNGAKNPVDFADKLGVFASQMGKSVERGATSLVTGVNGMMSDSILLDLKKQVESGQAQMNQYGNMVDPHSVDSMMDSVALRSPSDAEKKQLIQKIDQSLQTNQVVRELRDFAENKIDPIRTVLGGGKAGAIVERGLYGAASSVPMIGESMIPGALITSMTGQQYDRLRVQYPEMSPETAAGISTVSGVAMGALGELRVAGLFKKLPITGKLMENLATPTSQFWKQAGVNIAKETGKQFGLVEAQNIVPTVVQNTFASLEHDVPSAEWLPKGQTWQQQLGGVAENGLETLVSVLPFALLGAGVTTAKETSATARVIRDPEAMTRYLGIDPEAAQNIAQIAQKGDMQAADAAFKAAWKQVTPEARAAGAANLKADIDRAKAMQESQEAPTLRQTADGGYQVLNRDGSVSSEHADADSALTALTDKTASEIGGEHESQAMNDLKAFFEEKDPNRRVELIKDSKFLQDAINERQATPEQVAERMRMAGYAEGASPESAQVLGENVAEVLENLFSDVSRVYQGGSVDTMIEERAHGDFKKALEDGSITMEDAITAVREWAKEHPEFELNDNHTLEQRDTIIHEAVADMVKAKFFGNLKKIEGLPTSVRAFIAKAVTYFKAVFKRAATLRRLSDEGRLTDTWQKFLSDSVGLSDQRDVATRTHEAASEIAGKEISPEIQPRAETNFALRRADESWVEQLDKWQKGEMPSFDVLNIGWTPNALKALGAPDLQVSVSQSVLKKVVKDHDVTIADLQKLPAMLRRPLLLHESETQPNAWVAVLPITKAGEKLAIALHLQRAEGHVSVNRIASIYVRDAAQIQRAMESGKVRYLDEKNAPTWLANAGVQFPGVAAMKERNSNMVTSDDLVKRGVQFSIAPANHVERIAAKLDALKRDPDERLKIYERAQEKLAALNQTRLFSQSNEPGSAAESRSKMLQSFATLDAVASALPPEVRANIGGSAYRKLAELKTMDARSRFIESQIAKVDKALEGVLKTEYRERIDNLLDRSQKVKGGEITRGNLGAEEHRWFDKVREASALPQSEVNARMDGLATEMDALGSSGETNEIDAGKLASLEDEWSTLLKFGNLDGKDASCLASAHNEMQAVWEKGREKFNARVEALKQRFNDLRQKAMADALDIDTAKLREKVLRENPEASEEDFQSKIWEEINRKAPTPADKARIQQQARENVQRSLFLSSHGGAYMDFARELSTVFGDNSSTVKFFERGVMDAESRKLDIMHSLDDERNALFRNLFGSTHKQMDAIKKMSTPKEASGVFIEHGRSVEELKFSREEAERVLSGQMKTDLSPEEMSQLQSGLDGLTNRQRVVRLERVTRGEPLEIPMSELEAIQRTMEWRREMARPALEKEGWTQESIDQTEKLVSKEGRALRSWMADKYRWLASDVLNPAHLNLYGIDMPQDRNYVPVERERSGNITLNDPLETGIDGFTGGVPGFLKTPVNNSLPIPLRSAWDVFNRHVQQAVHWSTHGEFVRDAKAVLLNRDVQAAAKEVGGIRKAQDFGRWIRYLQDNGARTAQSQSYISKFFRANAQAALALNIGTYAKHVGNALQSLNDVGVMKWLPAFAKTVTGTGDASIADGWRMMRHEYEHAFDPVGSQLARPLAAPTAAVRNLGNWMTSRLSYVASAWNAISAATAFNAHIEDAKAMGMSEPQAREYAKQEAEVTVGRTTMTGAMSRKSLSEIESTGFAGVANRFLSYERQILGQELAAIKNAATGKGDWSKAMKMIVVNHVLLPMVSQAAYGAIRYMTTDDDFEKAFDKRRFAAAMILGPLAGYGFLGNTLNMLIGVISGQSLTQAGDVITAPIDRFKRAVQHISKHGVDLDSLRSAAMPILLLSTVFSELPTQTLVAIDRLERQFEHTVKNASEGKKQGKHR